MSSQGQTAGSIAIQAYPEVLPDLERALEAVANTLHDARDRDDQELVRRMLPTAHEMLEKFAQEECDRNPEQRKAEVKIATMYAIISDAAGLHQDALHYAMRTLELAVTKEERAKALHNVGCAYRNVNQPDVALEFDEQCIQLEPGAGWAIAGWLADKVLLGATEEGFAELLRPSKTQPMDSLGWATFKAYLDADSCLRSVRDDPRWSQIQPPDET